MPLAVFGLFALELHSSTRGRCFPFHCRMDFDFILSPATYFPNHTLQRQTKLGIGTAAEILGSRLHYSRGDHFP